MKTTLFTLAMIFIIPVSMNAQHAFPAKKDLTPKAKKHQQILNYVLNLQAGRHTAAHKPTDIQQRIIAQATSDGDSTVYKYTGTNGSSYNYNSVSQDEDMFMYPTEFTAGPVILENYGYSTTNLLADSILNYYNGELSDVNFAQYNAADLIDSFGSFTPDNSGSDNYKASYNPSGLIDSLVEYYGSGSAVVTYASAFIYNSAGKIALIKSYYDGNIDSTMLYYNSDGLPDSVREGDMHGVFTYYADNKLKAVHISYEDNGGVGSSYDSFGYTAGIDYATFYRSVDMDSSAIYDGMQMEKIPGANGKADTVRLSYYDENEWYADSYIKYHYNSYGNPDTLSAFDPEDNSLYGKLTFYYEEYDDGNTAVNNISDNKQLNVYPNPFSDNITMEYTGNKSNREVLINLTDITGRSVYHDRLLLSQGQNVLPVPGVPAGNYILMIRDADGKVYSNKMVKK